MAVFTPVDERQFAAWAQRCFGFAQVGAPQPIAEGIENSNFKFCADGRDYVFTIFEVWAAPAVAYYLSLMKHLCGKGLPVVAALESAHPDAARWQSDDGGDAKPCAVVPFIRGASDAAPDAGRCRAMGDMVAQCHIAAADFRGTHPNPRGYEWRRQAMEKIRPHLRDAQREMLATAAACDTATAALPLPRAGCHCDLFRNNVLWDGGNIAGIIDFYFGGEDSLIFDLAVCACDWCWDADGNDGDGAFTAERLQALLAGYAQRRHLCDLEKERFTDMLMVAATRFWVSRLYDVHFPRQAQVLTPHNPQQFENILRATQSMRPGVDKIMAQVA